MKAKRNLLSVLLVSVLLVATVCGVLVFGADAAGETVWYVDSTTTGTDAAPAEEGDSLVFPTIQGAANYAAAKTDWGSEDELRIEIRDSAISVVKASNYFLASKKKAAFREGNTYLPITVTSAGAEKVDLTLAETANGGVGNLYLINSYTFDNINFIPSASFIMYCGSSRTEFHDCTFADMKDANNKAITGTIQANGYLLGSYNVNYKTLEHRLVDGKLTNEVIFSGSTNTGSNVTAYALGSPANNDNWDPSVDIKAEDGTTVLATISKTGSIDGKVTVQDNAVLPAVYASSATGFDDATVTLKDNAKVTTFTVFSVGTVPARKTVTVNIEDKAKVASLLQIMNASGSASGKLSSGVTVDINVIGGSIKTVYLLRSQYNTVTAEAGSTIDFSMSGGAKVTSALYGMYAGTSRNVTMAMRGTTNITAEGSGTNIASLNLIGASGSAVIHPSFEGDFNVEFKDGATAGAFSGLSSRGTTAAGSEFNVTFDNVAWSSNFYLYRGDAATVAGTFKGAATVTLKDAAITGDFMVANQNVAEAPDLFADGASITLNTYGTTSFSNWLYLIYGVKDVETDLATLDLNANFYGGTLKNFRPVSEIALNGNLNVKVDTTVAEGAEFQCIGTWMMGWGSPTSGSCTVDVKGCEENPVTLESFFGTAAALGTTNTLENVTINQHFCGVRDAISAGSLTNTLTNVTIGAYYIGNGPAMAVEAGTTGKVINRLTDVEFTNTNADKGYYYGGSYDDGALASEVENEFTNVTTPNIIRLGNRAGNGTDVVTSTINSGSFGGSVYGGAHTSYTQAGSATINIYGGTFSKAVIANAATGSVVLKGGKIILNGASDNYINANKIEAATVIRRDEHNFKNGNVYFTLPATEDTSLVSFEQAEDLRGYPVVTNDGTTFAWEGKAVTGFTAYIDVTNRTKVRLAINKAQVEEAWANGQDLSYKYTCGALNLYVQGKVTEANWDAKKGAYVVELPAVSAADFGTTAYFNGFTAMLGTEVTINSIINLALAENSGFTAEQKAIFEALGNYGKAAAGTLEQATLDAAVIKGDASDIPTSGLTAEKGAGAINFVNKTLLMGDTIGIRLIADEATKANLANAKVYLGETELVSAGLCVVNAENGTVDLFINARRLNSPLTFVVEDGAGATCLTLTDTVKRIASQLVGVDATNMKAQATYNLIQAVQVLIAAEQA